jgi:anti-sigma factor RsiW
MNINRHNYEEYFLLYVDNELNIAQRKAVETFVAENPDLRAELIMLQQSVLPADNTVFTGKHNLLKNTTAPNPVNETNCEEYFVQYADDELNNEQKDQVEQFVYRNPQHQEAFELLQQIKLMPDTSIVYPDKYALYRHEEDEKAPVIRMRWWRIAAAAVVLIFAGAMGWNMVTNGGEKNNADQPGPQVAALNGNDSGKTNQPATTVQEQTQENLASKDKTPVTTPDKAQDLAVTINKDKTNNKDNKKNNQSLPQVKEPVKPDAQQGFAQRGPEDKKKNDDPGNKQPIPEVPKQETLASTLKPQEVNGVYQTNRGTINTNVKNTALAVVTPKATPEPIKQTVVIEEIDPDVIFASNDNNGKKNKSRGFFRKVSRVFDKATNADPDHEKSSIRIASFEIALK